MRRKVLSAFMVLAVLFVFAGAVPSAQAVLLKFGPVDPAHGYPIWYQDTTSLALDPCHVMNQAELDGGWCLLLPGDIPGLPPESFPSNFADEHFYWSGTAEGNVGATRLLLVLALEGAFGTAIQPGDQMVFARRRIRIRPLPFDGDYTVYTPFGKFEFPGMLASDPRGIFFSDDIGITPGAFSEALLGGIGPFLLPSATSGGAEMPPLTALLPIPDTDPTHFGGNIGDPIAGLVTPYPGTGKKYIADPARIGPVTGSPLPDHVTSGGPRNANIFRVEGPNGFLFETFDFNLTGRIFEGAIAGDVKVDRANYARPLAAPNKVDVFATAAPATQGRLPGSPPPAPVPTVLAYFDAPCASAFDADGNPIPPFSAPAGFASNQMHNSDTHYYGQSAPTTIPLEICLQANAVEVGGGTVTTFTPVALADQVFITEALFDPAGPSLSVRATSSDQVVPKTLTVQGLGVIDPATDQLVVNPLLAPPDKVTVLSSARGLNQMQVNTLVGAVVIPGEPVAVNDTATTLEDTATAPINVLANDTNVAGGTVSIVSQGSLGNATVNPADQTITYTPTANANGTDSFIYRVTVGALSDTASVTVTITPVNDPPVANPDSFTATLNTPTPLNVLANDTDPDGAADIVAVTNVSAVTPAGATATAAGNVVNFTATAAGTFTFTYRARDAARALSNTATVTVTVAPAEVLTIVRAQYSVSELRYMVVGTIAPAAGQTIRLDLLSGSTVIRTNTVSSNAVGTWILDIRSISLPSVPLTIMATSSNGTVATANLLRTR